MLTSKNEPDNQKRVLLVEKCVVGGSEVDENVLGDSEHVVKL